MTNTTTNTMPITIADSHGGEFNLSGLHVFTKDGEKDKIGAYTDYSMHCINYVTKTPDDIMLSRTSFGGNYYPDTSNLESWLVSNEGWHHKVVTDYDEVMSYLDTL